MQVNNNRINLMGCPIDNLTMEETLSYIDRLIRTDKPGQHVVVNVDKLIKLRRDPELKEIIANCDIINADGMPLVWASRILGIPLKERVAGIDLMQRLLKEGIEKKYRFYFLGAREEVIRKMIEIIKGRLPGIQIVGFRNGYWTDEEERRTADTIRGLRPDILFVAVSSPKKEIFLKKYLNHMQIPLIMGVGGSFDVLAGFIKRAPAFAQKIGLEWLWRLTQEPKRLWKRYLLNNAIFIYLLVREVFMKRILGT